MASIHPLAVEAFFDTSGVEPVRGFLHTPDVAPSTPSALILTHSAGSNCQAPLLVALAEAFAGAGLVVLRCDLPFRQQRPTGPPLRTAERDQAGLRAAVDAVRRHLAASNPAPGSAMRIFLGGHSYGGRMASMLAAAEPGLVDALLLLSYPLHPPRQPRQLRTKHFPELRTLALFVSGTHDGFGTVAELELAKAQIPARTRVLPIAGAGHELLTKTNRETMPGAVLDAFLAFTEPRA
jgi:predicted alpha/beta-hydrolase family hydrolase